MNMPTFAFLLNNLKLTQLNKKRQKQPGQSFILLKEAIFLRNIKKPGQQLHFHG